MGMMLPHIPLEMTTARYAFGLFCVDTAVSRKVHHDISLKMGDYSLSRWKCENQASKINKMFPATYTNLCKWEIFQFLSLLISAQSRGVDPTTFQSHGVQSMEYPAKFCQRWKKLDNFSNLTSLCVYHYQHSATFFAGQNGQILWWPGSILDPTGGA